MDSNFLFELPQDPGTILSLMACMPKNQTGVMNAWLEAPANNPKVLDDVSLVLETSITTLRKLFSVKTEEVALKANRITMIIASDHLPAILDIKECSSNLEPVNYMTARMLSEDFITRGYRGIVRHHFYSHPDFDKDGSCVYYLGRTWRNPSVHDQDSYELGISISHGFEKIFEPLLDACKKFGLQAREKIRT